MRSPQLAEGTWAAVRLTAQMVGVREAARRFKGHGVTEAAARKRSQREGWANDGPFGKQVSPTVTTLSPAATAAQVLAAEMQDLNGKTRLSHARAQAKVAGHVETLTGEEVLADAQNVKAAVQTANLLYGWSDGPPASRVRLEVLLSKPEVHVDAVEIEGSVPGRWDEV